MSEKNSNLSSEEVDLGYLFRKIGGFFKNLVITLFQIASFYLSFKIHILVLLIVGLGLGYFLDSKLEKVKISQGIIIANFESIDYLTNNIEAINAKITRNDTLYLQNILGNKFEEIKKIEIEPITDIYNVMTKSRNYIDVFKILFENQDLSEFIENEATSKYYKYHQIKFETKSENTEDVIQQIVDFWNTNEHYLNYASAYQKNTEYQVEQTKYMITQIDSILASINSGKYGQSNQAVQISDNSDLHNSLIRKNVLIEQILELEIKKVDYSAPIKIVSMDYDVTNKGFAYKILIPLVFITLFSLLFFFKFSYQKLKKIAEN